MTYKVLLPDTGTNAAVDIIEIHVKNGEVVTAGQTLLTLESDKATIDVPAEKAGTISALFVSVGDKIKTGDLILAMESDTPESFLPKEQTAATQVATVKLAAEAQQQLAVNHKSAVLMQAPDAPVDLTVIDENIFAGPAVRRLARLLGVDLARVSGSGGRGRLTVEDVRHFVKQQLTGACSTSLSGTGLPTMPEIDFAQFGPIEVVALTRIKQLTAQNLSRNWLLAPHVTQFAEADITELEVFRKKEAPIFVQSGLKLTPLVFIMKALVCALKKFPQMNASLDHTGTQLVLKKHYHIGIAVDTVEGLVVPVIRDVDQKSITELTKELDVVSTKAREKKLGAQAMQGSSFTISSLGGIGGTAFTPIINLPNVAILGISKSAMKPQYINDALQPRLMLPLSLSYDHRVIDGAEAARFIVALSAYLSDIRKCLI